MRRLPAEPLATALRLAKGEKSWNQFLGLKGRHPQSPLMRNIRRAIEQDTVDEFVVDRLCVGVLEMHPTAIYGADWWEGVCHGPEDDDV